MIPPLRFERVLHEKVWGGRALETTLGLRLPAGAPIGESWELFDRPGASSRVVVGEGGTLHELLGRSERELLGRATPNAHGRFPLLVKYLDAKANLSVQVHPDDAAAARVGGTAEGKSEAWFILAADPGAAVWTGVRPEIGRDELARRIAEATPAQGRGEGLGDGRDDRLADELLVRREVRRGDCIRVPGGTVHAIGAGVTLLEVQQNSDTTYRLYDWGRVGLDGEPRETHVEQALEVASFGREPEPPLNIDDVTWEVRDGGARARMASTEHFAIDVHRVTGTTPVVGSGRFAIYAVVAGEGALRTESGEARLALGDTWLVPASTGAHELERGDDELMVVEMSCE